jgi:uncharacterized protein
MQALRLTQADLLAIEREYCSRSLASFAKRAWPILEPATPLKWGWALDAICAHLEAVTRGDINRLLMNVPPGTMKSLLTGVIWPAWEWGPRRLPQMRVIGTSHKQDLAVRDAMKCRRLIQSPWYQARWPIALVSDQNAKTKFENDKTGFREAMAFTSMTGSRGDRIILDDPLSADDANSEAALRAADLTFTEALPTRVNNDKSAIVVIMQRLHEGDTSGIILARDMGYTHLMLPMRFEADRRCVTRFFADPRKQDGELLFADRFPEAQVAQLERDMGSYATAGQLQQRPSPRGGGMFRREWFAVVDAAPAGCTWVRGWDLAATASAGAAWTAGVLMGRAPVPLAGWSCRRAASDPEHGGAGRKAGSRVAATGSGTGWQGAGARSDHPACGFHLPGHAGNRGQGNAGHAARGAGRDRERDDRSRRLEPGFSGRNGRVPDGQVQGSGGRGDTGFRRVAGAYSAGCHASPEQASLMNPLAMIMNAARRLETMFPGYFPEAKHNHYRDFGWPENLTFAQLYAMYQRNGLARAGIEKTILKTWQDNPDIWETKEPKESIIEADIRQRFADLRLWSRLADTDRRSLVGGYAGLILRFADSKRFQEPVDRVPGGLEGLVEVIPAWAGQLTVANWNTDEASEGYGQPTMYQFLESAVGNDTLKTRAFMLHPDRVILWSADGTVHARSALEPGFNDLMTMEKVSGAGGEGFWKNAKSAPVLQIDKEARLADMAAAMGVEEAAVADAMNDQVGDWQKGFDKLLMLQGMEAKTLGITLPIPEHFFSIALQGFAASLNIPLKILVGNQTGERASTEDARDWSQTNMARRESTARPNIQALINLLERVGIMPERDWRLNWSDLTEASMAEKIERAEKMAGINQKMGSFDPAFTGDEIRGVLDMEPLTEVGSDDE